MADAVAISELIQGRLKALGLAEVSAVEAATWLDSASLLNDSPTRPGSPLRKLLRAGAISNAQQAHNNRWYIARRDLPAGETQRPNAQGSAPARPAAVQAQREASATMSVPTFDRPGLLAAGFEGFRRFKGISRNEVPNGQGVYIVLREKDGRPRFLDSSSAGWFQGRDPTVQCSELEGAWPEGAHVVYIGKAGLGSGGRRGLSKRIAEFRRFGDGEPIGHSGGRRIWQLADADDFVLAWKLTPDNDPEQVEAELLRSFRSLYGRLPVGNHTAGRRGR